MRLFIELTDEHGREVYISEAAIDLMYRFKVIGTPLPAVPGDRMMTHVQFSGNDGGITVKETPAEIQQKLKELYPVVVSPGDYGGTTKGSCDFGDNPYYKDVSSAGEREF